jgi:RNA polymerase sigma factor (sigma-70 family)
MATKQLRGVLDSLRGTALHADEAGRTDGQLLESYVRSREEAAFAALVRRHGPMVWGVCRRLLGREVDAEDAFQATFLVLVRRASSVVPRDMVANWLYGVARQTALKARATTSRRQLREKQVPAMPEPATTARDVWDELQPLLDQELGRLPDKYRAVIVLCDLGGKTRKEAAQHFRVPEGTVASRLAAARSLLAKRLTRSGFTLLSSALAAALSQNGASASVPVAVASSTVKAGTLLATGHGPAPAISARAIALADGVVKTMLLRKLKLGVALLLALVTVGMGAIAFMQRVPAAPPTQQARTEVPGPTDQPAEAIAPGDWPQWRGPNRDGIVRGVAVPEKWPKELSEEWRVPVGEGVASPVVSGGRVFVFTRENDTESVRCLDLAGGKQIWRSEPYAAPYSQRPEERNFSKGPRSTPAVADGRIYALGMSGALSCLDAGTGALLWRRDCTPSRASPDPAYGGSSPLVANSLCIVHAGDGKTGGLTAFDALTGDVRWVCADGYSPMSGSPILVDLAGECQVVTYCASNAAGVSAASGRKLWSMGSGGVGQPHTTPVRYRDLVVLNDILQPLRALRCEKTDHGIAAKEVWKAKSLPVACCSPVIVGDLVFGMSSRKEGCYFCLDATSGATLWESEGRQGAHGSLLSVGNVLLFLNETGRLIVVRPSTTAFEPIGEYQVSDTDTYAHPVFLGDRILIKDAALLRCYRIDAQQAVNIDPGPTRPDVVQLARR